MPMRYSTALRRSLIKHTHLCLRARFLHVGRVSGPNSSLNVNMNPARPPHEPVRALVASGTTQTTATTAQSSLLASSLGDGDRTLATFRTATTVATSVAASELYRGDSNSMAMSVSETFHPHPHLLVLHSCPTLLSTLFPCCTMWACIFFVIY